MCSRFELNSTPREIADAFSLDVLPPLSNQAEARPTDLILTIHGPGESSLLHWGLPAPWDGSPIFNARSETVREKPTFRDVIDHRCLIPASAWFEWRKDGSKKIKTRIAPAEATQIPFVFAGLRSETHATILTASAIPSLSDIHGRMPIVLSPAEAADWLDRKRSLESLSSLLAPHDVGRLHGEPLEIPAQKKADGRQGDLFG